MGSNSSLHGSVLQGSRSLAILGDKQSLFVVDKLSGSCLTQLGLRDWLGCVLGYRYSCVCN